MGLNDWEFGSTGLFFVHGIGWGLILSLLGLTGGAGLFLFLVLWPSSYAIHQQVRDEPVFVQKEDREARPQGSRVPEASSATVSRQRELVEVLNDVKPTSWDEIESHWEIRTVREHQTIGKHIKVNKGKQEIEYRSSKLKERAKRASPVDLERQVRAIYSEVDDPFRPSSHLIRFCTEEHDLSGSEARRRIAAAMHNRWLTEKGEALVQKFVEQNLTWLDEASDGAAVPDPFRRQLSTLEMALDRADCSVPGDEPLFWLLKAECYRLKREKFRGAIASEEPETLDDFVRALIYRYGRDWDNYLGWFAEILREQGIQADEELIEQRKEAIQQEIELDRFEAQLLGDEGPDSRIQVVDTLSGEEFEEYLEDMFAKMGYSVERTRLVGDQGADLIVSRFGERIVVQAKRYAPHRRVGNDAVQQVIGAVGHYDADRGLVVTTSSFSIAAETLAQSNGVELWDRGKLTDLLQQYP